MATDVIIRIISNDITGFNDWYSEDGVQHWSLGAPPGDGDDVLIPVIQGGVFNAATPYGVGSLRPDGINALLGHLTVAGSELDWSIGTVQAANGFTNTYETVSTRNGPVSYGSVVSVFGGTLEVAGSLRNVNAPQGDPGGPATATLSILPGSDVNNIAHSGYLKIDGPVQLTGGGTIALAGNTEDGINAFISGGTAGASLVNVGNTISGFGDIGGGTLAVTNGHYGLIQGSFIIDTSSAFVNDGTVIGGELILKNDVVNDAKIAGNSIVIDAPTVTLSGFGKTELAAGSVVCGDSGGDRLNNASTIEGAGLIGALGTFFNPSIEQALRLDNQAGGVIDANVPTSAGFNTLEIYTGIETFSNEGHIEATGGGVLEITSPTVQNRGGVIGAGRAGEVPGTADTVIIDGAVVGGYVVQVDNTGGIIAARSAGAVVRLGRSAITGGTVATVAGGEIEIEAGNTLAVPTATIDNARFVNAGLVVVEPGWSLQVGGVIDNTGEIKLNSGALIADANDLFLAGGGTVSLIAGNNFFYGTAAGDRLVNIDNTIHGGGFIGEDPLTLHTGLVVFVNQRAGVVDADVNPADLGSVAPLTIATGATNLGLMEATHDGTLSIKAELDNYGTVAAGGGGSAGTVAIDGTIIDNSCGTITANDGSTVLLSRATIDGGSVSTTQQGTLEIALDSTVDAGQVTNAGTLAIDGGQTLTIGGALNNAASGTVRISESALKLDSDLILTGGGTVELQSEFLFGSQNFIYGATGTESLINIDNTIAGAGSIGIDPSAQTGLLRLANRSGGTIDANVGAAAPSGAEALIINTGSNSVTNFGLIEATDGGTLSVFSAIDNYGTVAAGGGGSAGTVAIDGTTIENSCGTITANDGSTVLLSRATIDGGSVSTTQQGTLEIALDSTVDAGQVTNAGTLAIDGGQTLTIGGALSNTASGTVRISESAVKLDSDLILTGGGTVELQSEFLFGSQNFIYGATGTESLINIDNTIAGAGSIGIDPSAHTGLLRLANRSGGTIDANVGAAAPSGAEALIINTGSNSVTNFGLIEATDGGTLSVFSAIDNRGTLTADAGSIVQVSANVTNSGTMSSLGGSLTVGGSVVNPGTVLADGGAVTITGSYAGSGTAQIDGCGSLEFDGVARGQVSFRSGGGRLVLTDGAEFIAAIGGFAAAAGDSIDLTNVLAATATRKFYPNAGPNAGGGVLHVGDASGHSAALRFTGSYATADFQLQDDGHGGTLIMAA